jgi:hypothetical protein
MIVQQAVHRVEGGSSIEQYNGFPNHCATQTLKINQMEIK